MKVKSAINKFIEYINSSDIGKRLTSGAIWSLTGTAAAKVIVLVGSILCARILGKEHFGEFGMVRSTIYMFVVFGTAGLGMTATRYISHYRIQSRNDIPYIYNLTNIFGLFTGFFVALFVFVGAGFIASRSLHNPSLTSSLQVGALLLFVVVINSVQNGTLAGFEKFRAIALNNFVGSLFECTGMIVGALLWSVEGAVLGFGVGYIALYVVNQISIRRTFKSHGIDARLKRFRRKDLKVLIHFSIPAALSSMMVAPVLWIAKTMLVREYGFGELALYEAADQWKVMILFIPSTLSTIILPILSSIDKGASSQFWKVIRLNIVLNASIAFLIAAGICLFSPIIVSLYGDGYNTTLPLIYLAISTIFTSVASVIGVSIASRAKMWIGLSFNLFWGLLLIGFTFFFLNMGMKAEALALAVLLSYVVHAFVQYLYLRCNVKCDFKP